MTGIDLKRMVSLSIKDANTAKFSENFEILLLYFQLPYELLHRHKLDGQGESGFSGLGTFDNQKTNHWNLKSSGLLPRLVKVIGKFSLYRISH